MYCNCSLGGAGNDRVSAFNAEMELMDMQGPLGQPPSLSAAESILQHRAVQVHGSSSCRRMGVGDWASKALKLGGLLGASCTILYSRSQLSSALPWFVSGSKTMQLVVMVTLQMS